MKYIATIGKVGGQDQWDEVQEADTEDAMAHAEETTRLYNENVAKFSPWLSHLEVRGVRVLDARPASRHKWAEDPKAEEVTNAIVYRCERCGISGYYLEGFSEIKRGYLFRPRVFERCDEAKEYMKERGKK